MAKKIAAGAAVALVLMAFFTSYADMKRYIKISRM